MPTLKRYKTKYPEVFYILGKSKATGKPERIYYIRYRKDGKRIEEKAGRQYQDDMTAARASRIRSDKIEGRRLSNKEKRESEKAAKKAKKAVWTLDRLFNEYIKGRPNNKAREVDKGRYENYLKVPFGAKEPKDILPLDVDRLRIKLLKKRAPQTVKHILNLLTWIINFGVKKNLCEGISFHIQKPTVSNLKTEDLSEDQLKKLLEAIENDSNEQVKNLMKMVLYTGMRRGELFKLKWKHVDFNRGFIHIVDPKGGPSQKIPLNNEARGLLSSHPKTKSPYVFPGRGGKQRVSAQAGVNKIKKAAALPKDFRPLHGLRHTYASMLASSGKVDMYVLQRLLTHKSPVMTQRYAHLRDHALTKAAGLAGSIIEQAESKSDKDKVVNLDNKT
jgi:integrase